jgi:ABC-type transport system involved in cytochrome c biogenesis permease subunit
MPRPANQAMLAFSGKALAKAVETQGRDLSPLALEAAGNLNQHYQDIDIKDRAEPGTNSQFDKKYTKWLREKSAWVPLGVIREASIDELALAGYPTDKVEAFRTAFKAMEDEELANPGRASEKPALALIQAATDLGTAVNDYYYPTQTAMAREVSFNELAPFFRAPWAYGLAFLAFIFSMISTDFGKSMKLETVFGGLAKVLYGVGFIGFGAGIAFEVVGFYLRINITGWAPVTNMYETVIWVGLVSAVLGLILEAVYQKTWAALAGSGVGLVCTALAATVPLLDPQIKMLPPVLRSNFWLSIHVLTIVSSYAAFALAMVLGMAATTLYLTATYKRSASFLELAKPMVTGLPLLAVGILGYFASYGHFGAGEIVQTHGFWPSVAIGCVGSTITASAAFAILGELLNRLIFRKQLGEVVESPVYDPFATPASVAESASTSEARQLAMQGTAAMIKPVANFIYRSIQVGILLVTAGTFLGGWWADVSWGRFWGWDPKEVSALITLLVYLVPLHGRFAGWFNTFSLVMASVVCFLSVLMAWYGVNFVLGVGLHSYGFGTNAGQGYVGVATLIVLSYAMGTAWRRHVSQNVSLIVT